MAAVSYKTGVIEVAANAYAFLREIGATNAGFIVGEEEVIALDSPMTPALAGKLYAALIPELEQIHMFSGAGSDPPDHAYGVSGLPRRAAMGDCGVQAMKPSSETVGMGSPAMTQEDSDAFRDLYGV